MGIDVKDQNWNLNIDQIMMMMGEEESKELLQTDCISS
jgi:hypothetical protein